MKAGIAICFFILFQLPVFSQGVSSRGVSNIIDQDTVQMPLGGNTWSSPKGREGGTITNNGIERWTDQQKSFKSFFRVARKGNVALFVYAKVPAGKSEISLTLNGKSKNIKLEGNESKRYDAGTWTINDTGYIAVTIKGISKTGDVFADVQTLELKGSAITTQTAIVKNNEGNFYYWGRRGPSVHLGYAMPENTNAEWFYNEITVPEGNDVIGSYFMATGFAEGYFGIQVNSPTERRILFSVWSPFQTDDPKAIPADQKIEMLKKGENVQSGEFGNEGSGGQSFMRYMWKAGTTYRFLLHGVPDGDAHTMYTAYFFAPEKGQWMLIASFRRPKLATYLKRFHSFLENFAPEQGDISRQVLFGNQWIRDDKGQWHELNRARFTGDNTAAKKYRMDFAGGTDGKYFFLRNCGFFSNYTPLNTWFERPLSGKPPVVDFSTLP